MDDATDAPNAGGAAAAAGVEPNNADASADVVAVVETGADAPNTDVPPPALVELVASPKAAAVVAPPVVATAPTAGA